MILNIWIGWLVILENVISDLRSNVFLLSSNTWRIVPALLSGTIQTGVLAFNASICYTYGFGWGCLCLFCQYLLYFIGCQIGADGDNNTSETA